MLGAGGAGLFIYPSRRDFAPRRALKVLDEKRFAVLAAVADRTVRAEGADPVEIAHRVDETFATAVPEARKDFLNLLFLFENALPAFVTVVLIPLTLSITQGILWGFLLPALLYAVVGRWRDVGVTLWILAGLSAGLLLLGH